MENGQDYEIFANLRLTFEALIHITTAPSFTSKTWRPWKVYPPVSSSAARVPDHVSLLQ